MEKDYKKIEKLESRFEEIVNSNLDKISKIYWLLEDCKRYGTLPFAGLARAGFIAVQLLKSLVEKNIINQEEYQNFMSEVETVSSKMNNDYHDLSKEKFIQKYGHLRPGTYDITSQRYDEAIDTYFYWNSGEKKEKKVPNFKLSLNQLKKLQHMLKEHGLLDEVLELFEFIKVAIEGREYSKFVFTKNLSEVIRLFGELGTELGYSIDDCSYADIGIINKLYASSLDVKKMFNDSIKFGKENYKFTKVLNLPPIIFSGQDIYSFYYSDEMPNYITLKKEQGKVSYIENCNDIPEISNCIVIIPSADPGYDWIFSHNIKGFITKYGGANSHMAIRAGELGIPAAIGVGEKLFEKFKKAEIIEIDAVSKKVTVLKWK